MRYQILLVLFVTVYCHSSTAIAQTKINQQVVASPSPTASIQPTIEKIEARPGGDEASHPHNITIEDERSSWAAWVANGISIFVLLFLAYQTYVNKGMLQSMQANEGTIESQCKALTDLAEATNKQFNSMQDQLAEMSNQTAVGKNSG